MDHLRKVSQRTMPIYQPQENEVFIFATTRTDNMEYQKGLLHIHARDNAIRLIFKFHLTPKLVALSISVNVLAAF